MRVCQIDHRNANHCEYLTIPRSREVGQSYLSSVFTTLVSIVHSIHLVYRHQPQIVRAHKAQLHPLSAVFIHLYSPLPCALSAVAV